ncbi:hypothetical protein IG193_07895 [Infirmifilum lucidum]|uniref:RanBP2-type domain-containing protein n=1 Tax=Infirmifilum lucidum TaxID=2776706 RepID=A0A7L9FG44_9CREN|nr:hypothetical protein [Infirmifilum lucidum]QOJ78667.1 hypothetical protein IG193_07895 [Infirmifilum lucidum]
MSDFFEALSWISGRYLGFFHERVSGAPGTGLAFEDELRVLDGLRAEVEKYSGYLARLEDLHSRGEVDTETYSRLKKEYEESLAELNASLSGLKKRLVESGWWVCAKCGEVNPPVLTKCRKCGRGSP